MLVFRLVTVMLVGAPEAAAVEMAPAGDAEPAASAEEAKPAPVPAPYWTLVGQGDEAPPQYGRSASGPEPAEQTPTYAHSSSPPRHGFGLLIPGTILLAGFAGTIVADIVLFSGHPECHPCVPLTVFALPALLPGIPLTVAGAVLNHRYRRWKARMTFTPRATGFQIRF